MSDAEISRIVDKAFAHSSTGRVDEALTQLRSALAEHPESAMLWSGLASILYGAGKYQRGLDAVDRALSIDPEFYSALYERVAILLGLNRVSDAQKASVTIIEKWPEHPPVMIRRAHALSWKYNGKEGAEEIRALIRAALQAEPLDTKLLQGAAQISNKIGDQQKGMEYIDAALQLAPDDPDLLLARSVMYSLPEEEMSALLVGLLAQGTRDLNPPRRFHALIWSRLARLPLFSLGMTAVVGVYFYALRSPAEDAVPLSLPITALILLALGAELRDVMKVFPAKYFWRVMIRDRQVLVAVIAIALSTLATAAIPALVSVIAFENYRGAFAILLTGATVCAVSEALIRWFEFVKATKAGLYPANDGSRLAALWMHIHPRRTLIVWGGATAVLAVIAVIVSFASTYAAKQPSAALALGSIFLLTVTPALVRATVSRVQLRRATPDGESARPVTLWATATAATAALAAALALAFAFAAP